MVLLPVGNEGIQVCIAIKPFDRLWILPISLFRGLRKLIARE